MLVLCMCEMHAVIRHWKKPFGFDVVAAIYKSKLAKLSWLQNSRGRLCADPLASWSNAFLLLRSKTTSASPFTHQITAPLYRHV